MQMNSSRLIPLLLAVVMLLSIVSGCGSSPATTPEPTAQPDPAPATQAPTTPTEAPEESTQPEGIVYPLDVDGAVLTVWSTIFPGAASYIDSRTTNPVVLAVNEATGVTLEVTDVPGPAGKEQFNVLLAGGELPDFMANFVGWYTKGMDEAIEESELIYDLAPYVDEFAPDYIKALKDYGLYKDVVTDAGYLPQVANIYVNPYQNRGMIIRQDWLDAVNMEVPETYDELYDALTAFKVELGKESGTFFMCDLGASGGQSIGGGFGVADTYKSGIYAYPYSVQDGDVVFGWTQKEYKDVLKLYNKWFEEKLIWQDYMSSGNANLLSSNTNGRAAFAAGDLGVAFSEISDVAGLPASSTDPNMTISPMTNPVQKKGDVNHLSQPADQSANGWVITTDCQDLELCLKYVNYYFTEEGSELYSWGIEGKTYNIVNGKRQFTDLILNNPEKMAFKAAINVYCLEIWPGIQDKSRDAAVYDAESFAATDVWVSNADYAWHYPIKAAMNADESSLWATKFSEVDTYHSEMVNKFIIGEEDIDAKWDEYIATMNSLGAEECTECKQSAYDRYIKR